MLFCSHCKYNNGVMGLCTKFCGCQDSCVAMAWGRLWSYLMPKDFNRPLQCQTLGKIFTHPMCKLVFSFTVISDVYRSFIPNKTTLINYCLTQGISKLLGLPGQELWSKAAPCKFCGSGGYSLQNQANFHRSQAWPIVLIFNTGIISFS